MKRRLVAYAYASSPRAAELGHVKTGCYYSAYVVDDSSPKHKKPEAASTLESAIVDAVRRFPELDWSPWSIYKGQS